jgi:hypothetical protein
VGKPKRPFAKAVIRRSRGLRLALNPWPDRLPPIIRAPPMRGFPANWVREYFIKPSQITRRKPAKEPDEQTDL